MAEFTVRKELGTITIVEEVISTMAGYATVECIGVVAMSSKKASDGFVELLGKENLRRGVVVKLNESGAEIDIFVIVEYGVSISAVATTIVEAVKYRVESTTGVPVKKVNVTVEGIRVNE